MANTEGIGATPANGRGQPTRGFLFTDLRGYTAFLERNGAGATADLLATYRGLVRDAVARYDGAEVRTEGDSFYVVFPSISAAVQCGISIADIVTTSLADAPPPGVGVGVGVHAGEALDTEQGYVGSAINVAARLCALARPGEVLVSDTVRALTSSIISVPFVPLGRRQLKGVAEPISVYAVRPASRVERTRPRVRRRAALLPAVAVAAVVALVAMLGLFAANQSPGRSAVPSTAPAGGSTAAAAASPTRATATRTAPPEPAGLTAREDALLGHVPRLYQASCTSGPGVLGKAQLVCQIPDVGHVTYIHFDNAEAMHGEYDRVYRQFDIEAPGIPTCREGPYKRPYVGASGTQIGRVVCYEQTGQPNVVWTDDALEIIADVATDSGNLQGLYEWWQQGKAGPLP